MFECSAVMNAPCTRSRQGASREAAALGMKAVAASSPSRFRISQGPEPMRRFRSNSGRVAWLAIFALACQFVLTFGHIHSGSVSIISAALAISADASEGSAGQPPSPAQKVPTGLAQDFCAVCNHIGLANALVLPVSPATIPPISFIQKGEPGWQFGL